MTSKDLYAQLRGREAAESGPWAVPDRLILSGKVPRAARGTLPESERGHSQTSAAIVAALTVPAAIVAALTDACDEPASDPGPNASRRSAAVHVPDIDYASAQALLRQPPLPRGATGDRDVLGVADAPSLERADEVMLRGERLTEAELAAGGWHRSNLCGGCWARRVDYRDGESDNGTALRDGNPW